LPLFQDNLGKPHQNGKPFCINEKRDDGVAVTSAEPYANHLQLAPDNNASSTSLKFFTRPMLFLTPNQQCQSTELWCICDIELLHTNFMPQLTEFTSCIPTDK